MAFERLTRWWRAARKETALDDVIALPCHVAYVHWDFAAPAGVIEWDLTIEDDPGSDVGEYLALYNGTIDGSAFYFGLQTDVAHPPSGRGIGKGLIFSTWWSFDEADTRIAEDGFRELGTHEGTFVGVRRSFPWQAGDYRVRLARGDTETVGARVFDWFDLSITEPSGSTGWTWIGALRFPRRAPDRPARIEPSGVLFLEVYAGARTWHDVPRWSVAVMASGDGVRCPQGRTEYARFPHGQLMPNANARYDAGQERVLIAMGGETEMVDPPRPWR